MDDRDPRAVGARIARRRHQLGLSQVELAERIGVSPSSVANWERGFSYPKKKLGRVEQALGISLDGTGAAPAERSPPFELREGTRAAIRRDIGDPVLAEQAIAFVEAVANGRIPPASAAPAADPPESSGGPRRERG